MLEEAHAHNTGSQLFDTGHSQERNRFKQMLDCFDQMESRHLIKDFRQILLTCASSGQISRLLP